MKIKVTVEITDAIGAREFSIDVATNCAEFESDPRACIADCTDAFIRDEPNWIGKVIEEAKEVDAAQATVSAAQKRLAQVANERRHMLAK